MTSIDDLFKKSGLPSKRKLDPVRDPTETYKYTKTSHNGSSRQHQYQPPTITDNDDNDIEAGPAPPPDDDDPNDDGGSDYGPSAPPDDEADNDDEDGRFFGGGITAQEKEILDFMDTNPSVPDANAAPETINLAWLKKTALAFEKLINRNAELRARFESDPTKFIDSEADLDASIRALSILTEHPDLYPSLAQLGTLASLVSLLAHDNTDIAITTLEIIGELTDEETLASPAQWSTLVTALLEADLLSLLVSNFARLDESQDADRTGVYLALGIIENLCSSPHTAATLAADAPDLLRFLLARASKPETPVSQNKQYAAEILAILSQTSAASRAQLAALDAVDTLLQLASAYRKRDPDKGGDEEEYMSNLFEALTCLSDEPAGKDKFVAAEGVELCLLMLKEGKLSKPAALRLLDHAAAGRGTQVCEKIVEAGGLKTLFTLFMKSRDAQTTEHLVGVFASMLRLLPGESAERVRLLAKFVEKEYEKTARSVALRREYGARVAAVDAQIAAEKKEQLRRGGGEEDEDEEERADEWFSRRLDAGLFCLQTVDVILAWLVAEDDGARRKIVELLADRDESVAVIRATIEEQMEGVDAESDEGKETREMLRTLAQFLQ
ncbi:Catenin-beta-like protein [Podospora appendiculata]|uniref:Catenin-beta-like protein n=1 Tax=Podospora appendiculata TaxID=314037 RepID=A0AAE0X242_9PEZI|nr:Catenin-beta-like protein [Podospora appendiculata]